MLKEHCNPRITNTLKVQKRNKEKRFSVNTVISQMHTGYDQLLNP